MAKLKRTNFSYTSQSSRHRLAFRVAEGGILKYPNSGDSGENLGTGVFDAAKMLNKDR